MRNRIFTSFLVFVSACVCSRVVAADAPARSGSGSVSEYFSELPEKIAEDVHEAMKRLEMFVDDSVLAADVTIQPFVEREAVAEDNSAAAVEVDASFLAVKWPTAENDFASMSFVLYVPNGEQGTMHTMHICGFLFPDECSNEIPFPGKEFGRCGASDVDRDRTGYFCDFVALQETMEDNGGVLMSGTESLERYEEHAERVGDARAGDVEIHFELIRLGDEGDVDVDEDEDLSPAPAPSPAPAREPKSSRRMLPVRGPAFAGLQMTTRAGPGRRSFVTLPGSLSGRR